MLTGFGTNRSQEMEVFARAVELSEFSAAADLLGITSSAVKKLIAQLEVRLGAQLVVHSAPKLKLTPEGQVFYERCARILADIEEADRDAAAHRPPPRLLPD